MPTPVKTPQASHLLAPAAVLAVVVLMIVPLPPLLLDLLLSIDIGLAVVLLLTAIYVKRPTEFSVFPSLLLLLTLVRLSLNIASTRLVLMHGQDGTHAAGSVIQFVKGGDLKPLAVVQPTRSDLMPEVATIAEQGLPGLDAGVHFMLYAPAATPADVVSLLNGELNKIVGDPALKARFASIGYDPTALTPDAAAAIMRKTGEVWAPLIKRLNIKLD